LWFGNHGLLISLSNAIIKNMIFYHNTIGLFCASGDSTFCSESILHSNTLRGLYYLDNLSGYIRKNIFINNLTACEVKNRFEGQISNNFINNNNIGLKLWSFHGIVKNCELNRNTLYDIWITGNNDNSDIPMAIIHNIIQSNIGIYLINMNSYGLISHSVVNSNNFQNNLYFISYCSEIILDYIDARYNYFDGLIDENDIYLKIFDNYFNPEQNFESIEIEPFAHSFIEDGGLEQEGN